LIGLAAAVAGLICGAWFYRIAAAVVRPYVGSPEDGEPLRVPADFWAAILIGWILSVLAGMNDERSSGFLAGPADGRRIRSWPRGGGRRRRNHKPSSRSPPGKDPKSPPQAVVQSKIAPYLIDGRAR